VYYWKFLLYLGTFWTQVVSIMTFQSKWLLHPIIHKELRIWPLIDHLGPSTYYISMPLPCPKVQEPQRIRHSAQPGLPAGATVPMSHILIVKDCNILLFYFRITVFLFLNSTFIFLKIESKHDITTLTVSWEKHTIIPLLPSFRYDRRIYIVFGLFIFIKLNTELKNDKTVNLK
jgi:hypothetical protein